MKTPVAILLALLLASLACDSKDSPCLHENREALFHVQSARDDQTGTTITPIVFNIVLLEGVPVNGVMLVTELSSNSSFPLLEPTPLSPMKTPVVIVLALPLLLASLACDSKEGPCLHEKREALFHVQSAQDDQTGAAITPIVFGIILLEGERSISIWAVP